MKRKLRIAVIWALAAMVAIGVGIVLFVFTGLSGPLPDAGALQQIRRPVASVIYAHDGSVIGRVYQENRTEVPLESCPQFLIDALIATEDRRFFKHRGVDLRSFLRVTAGVFRLVPNAGGGSTITQQLAKNVFPRRGYFIASTPVNKLREIIIARRIERLYTKEEILELYLNTVSFGELTFGIGTAAERFFNTTPAALKQEQAATLVGILKAPTVYSPRRFPERAGRRRNVVFGQMAKNGYITQVVADSLSELPFELDYTPDAGPGNLTGYFLNAARRSAQNLLDRHVTEDSKGIRVETAGLKIYTSLDIALQRHAEQAVKTIMPRLQTRFEKEWGDRASWETDAWLKRSLTALESRLESEQVWHEKKPTYVFHWDENSRQREMSTADSLRYYKRILQTGLIALEPSTGWVKAWIGGIDYRHFPYERVYAQRQVGSTFKPIVYAAALEAGVDRCTYYDNVQRVYREYKDWTPGNADGKYGGSYSLAGGLAHSINTVSVQVLFDAGIRHAIDVARRLGISSDIPAVPSIALGTPSLSLTEITAAYAAFVNGGYRVTPQFITKIEDSRGHVLYAADTVQPEQALPDSVAKGILDMLQSTVQTGTGARLRSDFQITMPLAGKTGTTQRQTDGWFIGITPALVAGVWVGADDPVAHFRYLGSGQGGSTALPIFGEFFRRIERDQRFTEWREQSFGIPVPETPPFPCPPYSDADAAEMNRYMAALRTTLDDEEDRVGPFRWLGTFARSIFEKKDETPEQRRQDLLMEMQRRLDDRAVRMRKQGRSPTEISRELDKIRERYYQRIKEIEGEE